MPDPLPDDPVSVSRRDTDPAGNPAGEQPGEQPGDPTPDGDNDVSAGRRRAVHETLSRLAGQGGRRHPFDHPGRFAGGDARDVFDRDAAERAGEVVVVLGPMLKDLAHRFAATSPQADDGGGEVARLALAEELAVDAGSHLWVQLPEFDRENEWCAGVATFAYKVTVNFLIDRIRSIDSRAKLPARLNLTEKPIEDVDRERAEMPARSDHLGLVDRALERLRRDPRGHFNEQEVAVLGYFLDDPDADPATVAAAMDIHVRTVRYIRARIIRKVREIGVEDLALGEGRHQD